MTVIELGCGEGGVDAFVGSAPALGVAPKADRKLFTLPGCAEAAEVSGAVDGAPPDLRALP